MLMVLVAGVVLTNNVFAATETTIGVNELVVTINRSMSDEFETYNIQANDSLNKMSFKFSDQNNFSIEKTGEATWSISGHYRGNEFSTNSSKETNVKVSEGSIEIGNLRDTSATIIISKSLSNVLFDRIFENHSPFTFSAESTKGKTINIERKDNDVYTFFSNETLNKVRVVDGENNFEISKNGDGSFNVLGKYKGKELINKDNVGVPYGSNVLLKYDDMELGVLFKSETEMTITPDSNIIEKIKEELLKEKQKVTEAIVPSSGELDVSSNSDLIDIVVPETISNPKVKFITSGSAVQINKELTIDSQNTGMKIIFPEGVKITGLDDGIMNLPKTTSISIPVKEGFTTDVCLRIEVGSSGAITFDKPVTLIFPGMANKKVGFEKDGNFKEITSDCGNESPALNPDSECKIDSGNNLLVFTNHFTKFAVYSESAISTGGGGGGGSVVQYLNISNVNVNVKNDEASITFNVNRPASIVLKYGLGEGIYTNEIKETQLKTSHSFNLINLKESKYYYKIEARDKEGSSASYSQSFTLSGVPAISEINNAANMETSTKVKDQKTYNYNGVITTKPLNEMSKDELFRLFLILLLKSLLAQKGITL